MKRLQRHTSRSIKQRFTLLVILLVGTVVLVSTLGVFFLINGSLFVGRLFSKKADTQQGPADFYGTVNLDEIQPATNSAYIAVTGSTNGFDKVEFYINGEKVKTASIDSSDSFSEEIGELTEGDNNIYVKGIATDSDKKKESESYTVNYKKAEPALTVSSPQEGETVGREDLRIEGTTDKGNTVQVNGSPAVVNVEGKFNASFTLKEGENKISIKAADNAGNTKEQVLTVKYQK